MNKKEILKKLKYYFTTKTSKLYNDLLTDNGVEFIKVIKDVKVDGLRDINTYTISILYNKRHIDKKNNYEYWSIETLIIDKFDYTWDEIDQDGGVAQINNDIKEVYCIE